MIFPVIFLSALLGAGVGRAFAKSKPAGIDPRREMLFAAKRAQKTRRPDDYRAAAFWARHAGYVESAKLIEARAVEMTASRGKR